MSIHYTDVNLGLIADWTADRAAPLLFLVPDRRVAERLCVNLRTLHGESAALLPGWNVNPGGGELPAERVQRRRIRVLNRIRDARTGHLVVPVRGLGAPLLDPDSLPRLHLSVGDAPGPGSVASALDQLGFERRGLVEEHGDFSLRGDILDLFPEGEDHPVRISFFGDEIESLERFHPNTQQQVERLERNHLELSLQSEFALGPGDRKRLRERLVREGLEEVAERLEYEDRPNAMADWLTLWPRPLTHVENLLDDPEVLLIHPSRCWERVEAWDDTYDQFEQGSLVRRTYRRLEDPLRALAGRESDAVLFSTHERQTPLGPGEARPLSGEPLDLSPASMEEGSPIDEFLEHIDRLDGTVRRLHVHCGEEGFRDRLAELLEERSVRRTNEEKTDLDLQSTAWHGSFRRTDRARLSLDNFFNRTVSRGRIGQNRGRTEYLESFEDLKPGDLVVHEHFGIGRFHGLKRVSTHDQTRDCLYIEYRDDDALMLPPDQVAWVQKYVADSGFNPPLSSLSSGDWERVRAGVQEDVNELAEELLDLYTAREDNQTEPFPEDTLEQTQFEASFSHRETPDQQEAIEAVKEDLQSPRPMNRLICGDSGFGKTEVALRAAFKVASAGKQVAMLVPTTVLCRQHYETFRQRFSVFPYRVESLSRFRTPAETERILGELQEGKIDVVVGTHRLLSGDVRFDDLGLLVIDEEQRFGVEQKESLKFYRRDVDVLTLSATPIPRTLYMALSGVQEISMINTPPEDRIPVDIDVSPFDPGTARRAVRTEVDRGGQVFWVSNRVRTLDEVAEYVRALVPGVSVGMAHGQMARDTLRETMNRFYRGEIDVLVCTTIIESGLDCPNVNTMILQRAHRLGLAQLYQLRGRVGRSNERARAHLFYPEGADLTRDAEARLETIKRCSELGSGFRVAMRDLEIRGAGNLLGQQQHGNIRAVGFPLYCRMLQRAIRQLREEFEVPKPFPKLKFPGEHYLPRDYIPDEKGIIRQYQALASCRSQEAVDELKRQWRDTFGPIPDPARAVLRRHRFKIMADQHGWEDFRYDRERLNLRFTDSPPEELIEAARAVGAEPSVRSDRLLVHHLPPARLREWVQRVAGGSRRAAEPA